MNENDLSFLQNINKKRNSISEEEESYKRSKNIPFNFMNSNYESFNPQFQTYNDLQERNYQDESHQYICSSPHHLQTFHPQPVHSSSYQSFNPNQNFSSFLNDNGIQNYYPNYTSNKILPLSNKEYSPSSKTILDRYRIDSQMSVPSSQIYYFTSPPYLTNSIPYPQVTELNYSNNKGRLKYPQSKQINTDNNGSTNVFNYNFTPLNTLASLASDNTESQNNDYKFKTSIHDSKSKRKSKVDILKKKEGLEESSARIIKLLQSRGKMIFKEIHETLSIDYRRAYDILNILQTTSLITKTGKKRENKLPFIYQDGIPLEESVELRDLLSEIKREESYNKTIQKRIDLLEKELSKEEPNFAIVRQIEEIDPSISFDPIYKEFIKETTI